MQSVHATSHTLELGRVGILRRVQSDVTEQNRQSDGDCCNALLLAHWSLRQ